MIRKKEKNLLLSKGMLQNNYVGAPKYNLAAEK